MYGNWRSVNVSQKYAATSPRPQAVDPHEPALQGVQGAADVHPDQRDRPPMRRLGESEQRAIGRPPDRPQDQEEQHRRAERQPDPLRMIVGRRCSARASITARSWATARSLTSARVSPAVGSTSSSAIPNSTCSPAVTRTPRRSPTVAGAASDLDRHARRRGARRSAGPRRRRGRPGSPGDRRPGTRRSVGSRSPAAPARPWSASPPSDPSGSEEPSAPSPTARSRRDQAW